MEQKKYKYTVLTNPATYKKRHEQAYVSEQIANKRILLVKSNQYEKFMTTYTDGNDEIMLWDDWPQFEGYNFVPELVYNLELMEFFDCILEKLNEQEKNGIKK